MTDLAVAFAPASTEAPWRPALTDVSFELAAGELLALVGESGCGKSLTSLAILGLLPGSAQIRQGSIQFNGTELTQLSPNAYRKLRGAQIALIPQDPLTALNPVYSIGEQIAEVLRTHEHLSPANARLKTLELLDAVRIPNPATRANDYPHQFSGGMRQRVMIAMALACQPRLLIADEPTTALDVTVQAQILELLDTIRRERGTAILFITHDLGVVAEIADRVAVMYAGQLVETASVDAIFGNPSHPYTQGLLASIPTSSTMKGKLKAIPGSPPSLDDRPIGCPFAPRCQVVLPVCSTLPPLLPVPSTAEHAARCWLVDPACSAEHNALARPTG